MKATSRTELTVYGQQGRSEGPEGPAGTFVSPLVCFRHLSQRLHLSTQAVPV
jgi:hypothetical protein